MDYIKVNAGTFKYPRSCEAMQSLIPSFFNDLSFIRQPSLEVKLGQALIDCIKLGEERYQMPFGGWLPKSDEFGIATLRPHHLDHGLTSNSNRWYWTTSGTISTGWSSSDTFIDSFTLASNEMILILGYFNLMPNPQTIEIYIEAGDRKLPVQNIQPMRIKTDQYLLFPEPIIVQPYSTLKVDSSNIAGTTATIEEAGLLGYMIAPNSVLITK